jgi:N,N'-diacetyllegionaminate synthase
VVRAVKRATTFRIGRRTVGRDGSVYVIAEAGSNHDGDLDQAKRLVDAAAAAGADAVKFQLFHADRLYPKTAGEVSYLPGQSIFDVIRRLEMPDAWLPDLKAYSESKGLDFLVTPFDVESVDTLQRVKLPAYKIASYCLTHLPLLARVARVAPSS